MNVPPPNYTQTPNAIFALMPEMTECELRVVMAICRQTFGWHKQHDRISLSQLEELTGLSRQGVIDGIERAEQRGIIDRRPSGNSFTYSLVVSDVDQPEEPSQRSRPETVNVVDHQLVNVVDTQKKEYKERKRKNNIIPAPPEISQPEIEQAQNEVRGVTNPELAAVIGDIEERTGQLKPAQLKHIVELWEEFPYLDAHAHAYEATKKADFFNLNYYETCLVSFVAQHTEAKNGTHRTDSTEAKRERSGAAGARGNGRARGARSDISSPARG